MIGFAATTSLRNGIAIRKTQLEHPADVTRGELVKVEVFAGAAHLVTEGRAQTSPAVKARRSWCATPPADTIFTRR